MSSCQSDKRTDRLSYWYVVLPEKLLRIARNSIIIEATMLMMAMAMMAWRWVTQMVVVVVMASVPSVVMVRS